MTTSLALALAKSMADYFQSKSLQDKALKVKPPLPIDDAFLGVCLQNAGLTSGTDHKNTSRLTVTLLMD